ncbi:FbpB family small basic protein [Ectobacillus antri]|jgi:hypothetical protein|uniref:FbpB family small basic protein n=1 Tax=Ectobacillus antri TaxID=2486280 RepID=A0ABT6H9P1_9BACI|nr:FbpB family small basic protein [Ectobacillus antri]MDG4658429.1 FbpB family small basic protein [Ectobacillus antri]MDG5755434.1 FbpB family small basic protein [Ectobacillus antri]
MLKRIKAQRKSFQQLVQENKANLLRDREALEKIELKIEKRYERNAASAIKTVAFTD